MPVITTPTASTITFDQVVDEMRTRAPELTVTRAARMANWRLARMVGNADYKRKVTAITTSVADQATYNIPTSVIDIRKAWIGTALYTWASYDDIVELLADRAWLDLSDGSTGVVAATEDSAGNPVLYFYPTPGTTGDSVTVEESFQNTDVTYGSAATTVLPTHLVSYWAEGCYAEAYEASARQDLAAQHEAVYQEGIDLLRRFKNSRGGSGPRRIRLTR